MRIRYFVLGILTALGIGVLAGTNSLTSVSGGKVQTTHVNQYYTALNQDLVPRNSSGVATSGGGSLGTSTYPFTDLFTTGFWYLPDSSKWKIGRDGSNNIDFTYNGAEVASILTNGNSTFANVTLTGITGSGVVSRTNLVAVGQQASSAGSGSYTGTTCADITNLTVTITTTGRPVILKLVSTSTDTTPTSGTTGGYIACTDGDSNRTDCGICWDRGGTTIASDYFGSQGLGDGNQVLYLPCSVFESFDTPAAGTYTYKVQAAINGSANQGLEVVSCKLVAYEL